mmetsp:Transcript_40027/g.82358  ORF Transcript_40027/g.82358 Transcript_40027/m.82358 type:complete len:177 (-) Transcript_40027:602-1132(-)
MHEDGSVIGFFGAGKFSKQGSKGARLKANATKAPLTRPPIYIDHRTLTYRTTVLLVALASTPSFFNPPLNTSPDLMMASKSSPSSVAGMAKSDAGSSDTENENEKPDTSVSAGGSTSDIIDDEEDVQEEDESQLYFRAHVLFVGLRYYQGVAHIGGECGVEILSIFFVLEVHVCSR